MNLQQAASAIREASAGGAVSLARVPGVYPASVKSFNDALFCLVRTGQGKRLAVAGPPGAAADFEGTVVEGVKICELDAGNAAALREAFPWTAPVTIGRRASFGTGDRLGVCTPGHLRAFSRFEIFPVLAQQSMRELGRTGRTPRQVIDDAGWGAFEAGYAGTFAADADHIKQADEAVSCYRLGFTMFTIDASDHIDLKAVHLEDDEALERFEQLGGHREVLDRYLGKSWSFSKGGLKFTIEFSAPELARCALVYHRAVEHMALVYRELSAAAGNSVEGFDFEVSVDETETDTTVRDHLFVAGELKARGVAWQSLAPKFTGQFQKGIDYIGDLDEFERQFAAHALLAEKLGPYKVSVHSGSDKFSIFPLVGKHTGGFFHLKTAGTSWLEAVRVIAAHRPELYREMHRFALENFGKDRASYHVTTDLDSIPEVGTLADSDLPALMDKVDSRQLLHITYGSLLSVRDESGEYLFRDRIFRVLYEREEDLYSNLDRHIGRHLETLGTAAK
ncbi:MAG: tagaturonate epimerase family protein [Candidatus Glassbacteria bacterium]|nr:tagaturonate epimerase family protein [Candidatus Glassbacteria bacterium]